MTCYRRVFFLVSCLLITGLNAFAQVDTEFWFAPPEVTAGHGDSPLYLRLSTMNVGATIKVSQPARGNQIISTVTIPANTTHTIDLSSQRINLETISSATVMKTGLKIESTAPITAYYEVGAQWNSDIFALKGKNALGNRFVIPGQNLYDNGAEYSPTPYNSFDIVATANNTVVKVRPSKPLYGHPGDTLIIIRLNAGETYSLRKTNTFAINNPIGTSVESNKPIAITLKDDSVINGACRDLLGDQLIPVEVAGNEYVVLRGFLSSQEYLFITATENDTEIFVNDATQPRAILSKGQVHRYPIAGASTYVRASKTIYVFHVTGFGCEMGMAILPSIDCKGSTQIGFSRTTAEFFGLNIMVRKEGIGGFRLNGSTTLVPSTAFSAVPGTNDKWYAAQLSFQTNQILVGQASLISNTQNSFQIGIINGNASTTCKYGYFSAFSTLFIGDDFAICEGQTATLDAGADKESYEWNTGATSQKITIADPGKYWVKIVREECVLYDTINVDVRQGHVDIVNAAGICPGEMSNVDGKENFSWKWSDGSTDRYLKTRTPGKYWVNVFDYTGCEASDTVYIQTKTGADLDLGSDVQKCPRDTSKFDVAYPSSTYLWSDGKTTPVNSFASAGNYWVKIFHNGCTVSDTVAIQNFAGPQQDTIYGSPSVCPLIQGVTYETDDAHLSVYDWHVEGGTVVTDQRNRLSVDWGASRNDASVNLVVTDSVGCTSDTIRFQVRINPELLVELPSGPDTLCINKAQNILYTTAVTNGSVYDWNISGGDIISGQGTAQVNINWREGLNTLFITESSTTIDTVCTGVSQELSVFVFRDNTSVGLDYVTVDTVTSGRIHIQWSFSGDGNIAPINLYKRAEGSTDWQIHSTLAPDQPAFIDDQNVTGESFYDYFVGLVNDCEEELITPVHRSIQVEGSADSTSTMISLSWNHYQGWPDGVGQYEVWRKLDDASGYRLLTTVPATVNSFSAPLTTDGFRHLYVIRAVDHEGLKSSWSNQISFEFEHPVYVPNVFTPNSDGKNQFFYIVNIHLYEHSVLTIVDRWGKEVMRVTGYQNDWDGGDANTGVYFYTLRLDNGKKYKGMVSISR